MSEFSYSGAQGRLGAIARAAVERATDSPNQWINPLSFVFKGAVRWNGSGYEVFHPTTADTNEHRQPCDDEEGAENFLIYAWSDESDEVFIDGTICQRIIMVADLI